MGGLFHWVECDLSRAQQSPHHEYQVFGRRKLSKIDQMEIQECSTVTAAGVALCRIASLTETCLGGLFHDDTRKGSQPAKHEIHRFRQKSRHSSCAGSSSEAEQR